MMLQVAVFIYEFVADGLCLRSTYASVVIQRDFPSVAVPKPTSSYKTLQGPEDITRAL